MKGYRLVGLFLIVFSYNTRLPAQGIDSLTRLADRATGDSLKLAYCIQVCEQDISPEITYPYLLQAERLVKGSGDKFMAERVAYYRALYYARKNETDSALAIINPMVQKYKKDRNNTGLYLKYLFFRSKLYDRGNQYTRALQELVGVVEMAKSLKDTLVQIQAKTGIGWVQMELEQYREALRWLLEALHTSNNPDHYKNYGALYSNLASSYNSIGMHDSAMYYINIAIEDARKYNTYTFLATALSMQAKIFIDDGQKELAEKPLNEVVEIRKKLEDPYYMAFDMSSLASYYASTGQPQKGIRLCKEGIELAKGMGLSSQLLMVYKALAENYKVAGKDKEYGETLEYILSLKDSFNIINTAKQVSEWQSASEFQKKEKEIAEQQLQLTQKNYQFFGSVLFLIMGGAITILAFLNYRRRQRMKIELAIGEEKRNAANAIREAGEQERKRIAADLHDNIGAYASAISADVEKLSLGGFQNTPYALDNLRNHSAEIIRSLRDTIWVLKKEDITLTSVSDRIKNYVSKLASSYPAFTVNSEEQVTVDIKIGSKKALNLYRIIQEAVSNSLKHSEGNELRLSVKGDENGYSISVKDNGKGIGNTENREGNGLQNIKLRAEESGFDLDIISAPGSGTEIIVWQSPAT